MKFRIKEKPKFDNWTGKWETMYVVQRQFLYFFWLNISEWYSLISADCDLTNKSQNYFENQSFKKTRKVIKEIEV